MPEEVDVLTLGFSCKSKTKLSSSRSQNVHAIARGSECETAKTWEYSKHCIIKSKARLVILDNVEDIVEDGSEFSDLQQVLNFLAHSHSVAKHWIVSALDYGSLVRKKRCYIIGYRAMDESAVVAARLTFFLTLAIIFIAICLCINIFNVASSRWTLLLQQCGLRTISGH